MSKKEWRRKLVKDICPACIYYEFCRLEHDCQALKVLVDINENVDRCNPDN